MNNKQTLIWCEDHNTEKYDDPTETWPVYRMPMPNDFECTRAFPHPTDPFAFFGYSAPQHAIFRAKIFANRVVKMQLICNSMPKDIEDEDDGMGFDLFGDDDD